MLIPREIKTLIFDLGGVIINLDVTRTHKGFADLAQCSLEEIKSKILHATFFDEYEKGMMTDEEFRSQIRSLLNVKVTDHQIDLAWNAMLLDIPKEKYEMLLSLQSNFNVFLLSNTNNIHLQAVNKIVFKDTKRPDLSHFFHRDYYSHLMKMRKPNPEIFARVLKENNLAAQETFFLDDNLENIHGAKSVGIQTAHITSPQMVIPLFA